MAPAAAQTLLHYFADTGTTQQDFDAIFTGDLGEVGSTLLHELMHKADCPVENHQDCGCLLYDVAAQNVQAAGPGAVLQCWQRMFCRGWWNGAGGGCSFFPPGR